MIKGHKAAKDPVSHNGKCLTLFTSGYHVEDDIFTGRKGVPRRVAIADFDKTPRVRSVEDLVVEEI